MSQITQNISSIGPAGPIVTLTGNDSIAVAPDGAGNIDILGADNSFINIYNSAPNTLTVERLDQVVGTVQTTDDTPTSVVGVIFPVSAGRAVILTYQIIAALDDYSQMYSGTYQVGAYRMAAGATTLQQANIDNFNEGFLGDPDVNAILSGNSVQFNVIGVAATTINWKVVLNWISI